MVEPAGSDPDTMPATTTPLATVTATATALAGLPASVWMLAAPSVVIETATTLERQATTLSISSPAT
ncbi:MAG: hypothetical protein IPI27_13590 [Betaproteobacteria bacterium]|nr:hypothetical protein [Betaproteobacteria bacterium]